MAEYHNQSKLRFWCQMVLPLVYDDSLSYMELLNKVVTYLNNCIQDVGNCETNIESLLEAFVNLQDYVNEIAEDITSIIEEKIDEMIESGEFGEILADALATVVAPEYDSSESYVPLNYAIKDGTLYCCTNNTTGEWDSTKWRETTVGDELNTLMQRVFALNAGQVSYDESATYSSGTVGNKLKNLSANDIAYNSSETYNDATVGKELSNLNGALTSINKASKSRKFVVISDSYGLGVTAGGTTTGWIERFRSYLGLTANTNFYSSAVGGSGFVGGVGVATFNDQLNTLYNTISGIANTITDVIFAGGYNDRGYWSSTLPTAIETAITNAKTKFPNAKIWVFSIGYFTGNANTPRNQLIGSNIIYEQASTANGATYADISKVLKMCAAWMSSDTIHPTADGYKELGANIANAVQGGTVRTNYLQQTVTLVPATGITINPTTVWMEAFNDNIVLFTNTLALDRFQFPAGTLLTNNWTTLCSLTDTLIHGTANLTYYPVTGFLYKGSYETFQGFIRFDENKLQLLVRNIANGAYEDMSTVTRVTIDFFGIKVPIDCV